MKHIYALFFFIILLIPKSTNAQCFDCIKTSGSYHDDFILSLEKTKNGFVSNTSSDDRNISYYDNNCNLIWQKKYNYSEAFAYNNLKTDQENNIYVFEYNGETSSSHKNITKFDQHGTQQWEIIFANRFLDNHPLSIYWDSYLQDYHITNNKIFIIGYFHEALIINGKIIYDFRSTDNHTNKNFFISEFDLDGNYIKTKILSRSDGIYSHSVTDEYGNIYLLKNTFEKIELEKFDSNLNLLYRKSISHSDRTYHIENTTPVKMYFSKLVNKILIFSLNSTAKTYIGGNLIDYEETNGSHRHMLFNINPTNGEVINSKKLNFIPASVYPVPTIDAIPHEYYFDYTESEESAYILTRFNKEININGKLIKPKISKQFEYTISENDINYDTNIISFKINPENFDLKPILYTNGGIQETYRSRDFGKFIRILDEENILISGEFQSLNFEINGIHIPNKSVSQSRDFFIYKYNLNNKPNNISIKINNSCFGQETNFTIDGDFDSVKWDFGDGNSSTDKTPKHIYTNPGKYIVKTTVTCKGETREFTNEVNIKSALKLEKLNDIIVCENNSNEGIGSFDTSIIPNLLTKNQTNYTLKYYDVNDNEITNFISKTYQNKTPFQEKITIKGYFNENPTCISETSFLLKTSAKSELPILKQDLNFCVTNIIKFQDILVEGKNLLFYDANNTLINPNQLISNGKYYVTQSEKDKCESNKLELNINIQNTPPPNLERFQSFCSFINPKLNSIQIEGENITWYNSETSTIKLDPITFLEDNKTYYASQTINNCESISRTSVTIHLSSYTLITSNPFEICKNKNTIGEFDLNLKLTEIASILSVNKEDILFFDSLENAQKNINPIASIYNNQSNLIKLYATTISTNACKTFVEIPLIENMNPTIRLKDSFSMCKDSSIEIKIDQSYDQITWSTGETNKNSIQVSKPGEYSVTVTNNNCSVTKKFIVNNYNELNIEYKYDGKQVHFTILNDLNTQISLDGVTYISNYSFTLEQGEYTFYFKSSNGCIEVKKIYLYKDLPTVITPNSDGINDYWNLSYIKLKYVRVFNRYGNIVFEATKENQPIKWNGKHQLKQLPTDTYWYSIVLENDEKINGSLLIKNK